MDHTKRLPIGDETPQVSEQRDAPAAPVIRGGDFGYGRTEKNKRFVS